MSSQDYSLSSTFLPSQEVACSRPVCAACWCSSIPAWSSRTLGAARVGGGGLAGMGRGCPLWLSLGALEPTWSNGRAWRSVWAPPPGFRAFLASWRSEYKHKLASTQPSMREVPIFQHELFTDIETYVLPEKSSVSVRLDERSPAQQIRSGIRAWQPRCLLCCDPPREAHSVPALGGLGLFCLVLSFLTSGIVPCRGVQPFFFQGLFGYL